MHNVELPSCSAYLIKLQVKLECKILFYASTSDDAGGLIVFLVFPTWVRAYMHTNVCLSVRICVHMYVCT